MLLKTFTSAIIVVALCSLVPKSHQAPSTNNRPIFGLLLQEQHDKQHQYVASSYVKWLESGGARVVPIFVNKPRTYYEHLVESINGVLMPGGGTPLLHTGYSQAADLLLDLAIAKNEHGSYFPVWGTCLSFQKFATYFTGNVIQWDTRCNAENLSLNLDFPEGVNQTTSKMLKDGGAQMMNILSSHPVTPNYHLSCLGLEYFEHNHNLSSQFVAVSTNTYHGVKFVSTLEHRKYPIYGTQWHPEKNQFEWVVNESVGNINHDVNAIRVGQYFANFLVNEARKNVHHFVDKTEEANSLMYNYHKYLVYTGQERGADFEEIYKFPLQM